MANVNKVTNANVYANGATLIGKVAEFTVPDIMQKTADHMALGVVGTTEHFVGFEKLEGSLKWSSVYPEIYSLFGNPFTTHKLQLRANVDIYGAQGLQSQVAHVVYLNARFKKLPGGAFKAHENVDLESELAIDSVKIEFNGVTVLEYDAIANIYRVGGVDVLAQYNANLGA